MREFNTAPNTQIGKIILPYKVHDKEGHIPSDNFKFNRSREFSEDYTSKDWLEFSSRWFHLATYEELLDDIQEYLNNTIIFNRKYSKEGLRIAARRYDPNKTVINVHETDTANPRKHVVCRLEERPKNKKE